MKSKRFYISCATFFILFSFLGCKRPTLYSPGKEIIVIKFKQQEYREYILAQRLEPKDRLTAIGVNRCKDFVDQENFYPYWNLPDNWLLLDWKWFDVPHGFVTFGFVLLREQTWDKLDFSHQSQSWPLSEPHINNPIEAIYYINPSTLEAYSSANYDSDMEELINATWNWPMAEKLRLCEISDTMDSIWAILQNDISVAIENGDIDNLTNQKYYSTD